jgi:F0F1-type ATP synthase alpha subunit
VTPGILARKPLCRRLRSGIKAVDVFHPLAHGQVLSRITPGSLGAAYKN